MKVMRRADNLNEPAMQAAQEGEDDDSVSAVPSTAREGIEETEQHASESVAAVGGPTRPEPSEVVQSLVAAGGRQVGPNEVEGPNSI